MSDTDGTCEYVLDPADPDTWGGEEGDELFGLNITEEYLLNKDGVWRCPHDAESGEDLCIFHLPLEEKDEGDVVDKFWTTIKESTTHPEPNTVTRKRQFLNAKFGDFDLSEVSAPIVADEGLIDLSYSDIDGKIDWSDITIDTTVIRFVGVKVTGDINFRRARLKGITSFKEADFRGELHFRESTFEYLANFSNATFMEWVHFRRAIFKGEADFGESIFEEWGTFAGATFEDEVDFGRTTFEQVSFSGALFKKETNFSYAAFGGPRYRGLTREEFKSRYLKEDGETTSNNEKSVSNGQMADFSGVTFVRKVNCRGVTFRGDADIAGATFEGLAHFSKTIFEGDANFSEAVFEGEANFTRAKFEQDVTFSHSEFTTSPDFEAVTIIEGRFEEASVNGINLSNSNVRGANFRSAHLENAELEQADLSKTNLERTKLSGADLFGADLSGALLYKVRIGDVGINTDTILDKYGDNRCVYDPNSEYKYDSDDEKKVGQLRKAMGAYHVLEQLSRANTLPDKQAAFFVRRQDMRRAQLRQEGSFPRFNYWFAEAQNSIFRHGESFSRVVAWAIGTIAAFAFVYPLGGWLKKESPTGELQRIYTYDTIIDSPILLWESFNHSALLFLTGSAPLKPVGFIGEVLTTIEALIAPILLALLVFVLGRRAAR